MNKNSLLLTVIFLLLFMQAHTYGESIPTPEKKAPWQQRIGNRFKQIWYEGNKDLYLTGYAWHNRYTYSAERRSTHNYNEHAWGGGLGKGFYDEDGDWQGLYSLVFLDSHKNVEPWAGYGFLKTIHLVDDKVRMGGGFTLAVTMRPDINNGYPFPAATPLLNVSYKHLSVFAAYVPGLKNGTGNVLFIFGRWSFGY